MGRLTAASSYELELFKRKHYRRFFMLTFDAGLELDPVQATHDFLQNHATSLEPSALPIPEELLLVYLRRDAHGDSPLTPEEIKVLSEVLRNPTDAIIEISKGLITRHVRLSKSASIGFAELLEMFIEALGKPKRRGRTTEQYADRNQIIRLAVERLTKAGLKKFGGDLPACEIVSDELCRVGHPISADGVRKIVDAGGAKAINDEMVDLAIAAALEGMSVEKIRARDDAWLVIEDFGKKEGYIPSSD